MKSKNFILAAIVFAVATGSAFASLLWPEQVYVWALKGPGSPYVCTPCSATCDFAQWQTCNVTVTIVGGVQTVRGSRTGVCQPTYRASSEAIPGVICPVDGYTPIAVRSY